MKQPTITDILERFDLLNGIAPPDSLKGRKSEDIKDFIRQEITALVKSFPVEEQTFPEGKATTIKSYNQKVEEDANWLKNVLK
ncbi:MAG: hypothetical protein WCT51_04865 [Candidatus Shapirobacteria bacterium]|jgi:hypothetical protein